MIVVRDVFQLRFGKAREALELWKEGRKLLEKMGYGPARMLTDLVGLSYTLVLETSYESLAGFEKTLGNVRGKSDWQAWYQQFVPLAESARREMFTVVE